MTVPSTDNNLVSSYCFDGFDSFSARINAECEHFVLDLETYEVTTSSSSKQKIFSIFAVSQTSVLPHKSACIYGVIISLTRLRI